MDGFIFGLSGKKIANIFYVTFMYFLVKNLRYHVTKTLSNFGSLMWSVSVLENTEVYGYFQE